MQSRDLLGVVSAPDHHERFTSHKSHHVNPDVAKTGLVDKGAEGRNGTQALLTLVYVIANGDYSAYWYQLTYSVNAFPASNRTGRMPVEC